jgi:hypothetical protein
MVAINFGQFSERGRSSQAGDFRLVNGYIETRQAPGRQVGIWDRPGVMRWDSFAYTGPNRGLSFVRGKGIYAVTGNQLVRFIDGASREEIGIVSGASDVGLAGGLGLVTMASNMRTDVELGLVTEDGRYYYLNTNTGVLTEYAGGNLPGVRSIDFIDRYFVFALADGRLAHTELDDAGNIDPLAFAYAESRPDGLKRIIEHRGAAIALGESSLEVFENAATTPFAFAPTRSDIEIGLMATFAACRVKDRLLWPDHHGEVQEMVGSEPERVSDHGLEILISELTPAEQAAMHAQYLFFQGHHLYVLNSAKWSYVFDTTTRRWFEWSSHGGANFLAQNAVEYGSQVIMGSREDGGLYYLDPDAHADDDAPFTLITQSATVQNFPNGGTTHELAVDAVTGVGVTGGPADAADPKIVLDWTIDGGKTWKGGRIASLGQVGQYQKEVAFRSLGSFGNKGVAFRLSSSSPVQRGILAADARIDPNAA